MPETSEWFYEKNVVDAIVAHLKSQGWVIEFVANTEIQEHGADVRATKDGQLLLVEAKGYPSECYVRGERKGQLSRTNPNNQARMWYSHVLLAVLLQQDKEPKAKLVIGLPVQRVYLNLLGRTVNALDKLGVDVLLVHEDGKVMGVEAARLLLPEPNKALRTVYDGAGKTAASRIICELQKANQPVCDDCLTILISNKRRQYTNQECTRLKNYGEINRAYGKCGSCRKQKLVSWCTVETS